MIKHIDIEGQKNYEVNPELTKYIQKKIGKLDRHLKRSLRADTRADVKLKETNGKGGKQCIAEVILHIPGTTLTASDSTMNMFAAVDIVEAKLQNQLKREKEKKSPTKSGHKKSRARQAFGKMFKKQQ